MKRTPMTDYINDDIIKPIKNSTASKLRENDIMIQYIIIPKEVCDAMSFGVLIYTKYGEYVYLNDYKLINEFSRNASGIQMILPKVGDSCIGFQLISPEYQKYAIVITKKGCMKRIELEYLGKSKKRKDSSYIATIKDDDEIFDVISYDEKQENYILRVSTRYGDKDIPINTIPILGRKAKPAKIPGIDNVDIAAIVEPV
jgi:DNA gyrase/topoisomerase IV subunit A